MGASSVAAAVIMFISAITVATAFVMGFNQYAMETTDSLTLKRQALTNSLRTDAVITNVDHNLTTNLTTIHVLNTGNTELKVNFTDIILGGYFIARDENKSVNVLVSTTVRNPLLWDPSEVIEIVVNKSLDASRLYTLDVITQYGVKISETFST